MFGLTKLIALIILLATPIVLYILLKISKTPATKRALGIATLAIIMVCLLMFFLPIEYFAKDFDSPEAAFNYQYAEYTILQDGVIENEDSALIFYTTDKKEVSFAVFCSQDGRWKITPLYKQNTDAEILGYCCVTADYVPDSDNFYIVINGSIDEIGGELSTVPTDSVGTAFERIEFDCGAVFHVGFVEDSHEDYCITVDGNTIEF